MAYSALVQTTKNDASDEVAKLTMVKLFSSESLDDSNVE